MTGLRHLTYIRRTAFLVLVVCALAIRAFVPAGWMPMVQADGAVQLVLCPGSDTGPAMAGMTMSDSKMSGMAMPGMTVGAATPDSDPIAPSAGHDCPFAVTALAVDLAIPIKPPVATPIARIELSVSSPAVQPGRGLAAPPPPATGPPILA